MLRQWTACVKGHLLRGLHGHQCKALACVSLAAALAGHCHGGRVAAHMPGGARPASGRRRIERLLSNPRLRPSRAAGELARSVLADWSGSGSGRRELVLILDETPGPAARGLECMKVSAGYRGRAIPLAWECYREDRPPVPMPQLICRLLRRVARLLPPEGVEVTLLADRGLSWPVVIDCCMHLGWHYVLRLQRQTKVRRTADGTGRTRERECEAIDLAPAAAGGPRWSGAVRAFKKARWRDVHLTALWEDGCKEPWLLASDRPGPSRHVLKYCKRTWIEQGFRDDKGQSFNWDKSRVADPARASRLLLVLALATLLAVSLGSWVLKRGLRRALESTRRRALSLVQIGLRWLRHALISGADAPCRLYLVPP
jgi:hypothetical protein